jgi:hypothetical protein
VVSEWQPIRPVRTPLSVIEVSESDRHLRLTQSPIRDRPSSVSLRVGISPPKQDTANKKSTARTGEHAAVSQTQALEAARIEERIQPPESHPNTIKLSRSKADEANCYRSVMVLCERKSEDSCLQCSAKLITPISDTQNPSKLMV